MKPVAISLALFLGLLGGTPASAYIGEGVQGRPHGGNTADRLYSYRHGVPYTGPRHRHHLYGSPYRTYRYGR